MSHSDQFDLTAGSFPQRAMRRSQNRLALSVAPYVALLLLNWTQSTFAQAWPKLPEQNGAVEIPAQEWPLRPGPRTVRVLVHYPAGNLASISPQTGVMLTLHNWGGTDCVGTASPTELAKRLNVVALCVNYLQSGPKDSIEGPEPYDFGYLQGLDALRALYWVTAQLKTAQRPFADNRYYCTGGSGGGNVTLMANKLAPRTFACVIDMCGMKKLSDEIAFNLPGNGGLNARWSRDPASPNFLSRDEQELRFVGHPSHLAEMKRLGSTCRILVVHGVEDAVTSYPHAVELVENLRQAKLDVEPHFIARDRVDGTTFTSTGHSLGNRTRIVFEVAGKYLEPGGAAALLRTGPSDFDRREDIRYRTTNGEFIVSYREGFPVGRVEKSDSQ